MSHDAYQDTSNVSHHAYQDTSNVSHHAYQDTSNVSHHAYQDSSSTYRFLAIILATGPKAIPIFPNPGNAFGPNVIVKQSAMIPKHQAFPGA